MSFVSLLAEAKGGGFSGVWIASDGRRLSSSPPDKRGAASARFLFLVEPFGRLEDGEGEAVSEGTANFVGSCLGGDAKVDVL